MEIKYGYAKAKYAGNGATAEFSVPFSYLNPSDLFIFVYNDSDGSAVAGVNYTFINPGLISVTPTPAMGQTLWIERDSSVTGPRVSFADSTSFTAADIDTAYLQALYVAQEALDEAGILQLGTKSIDDFVNESQANATSAAVSAANAAASSASAFTSATGAANSATDAAASASAAAASATTASDGVSAFGLLKANNLSDLASAASARGNLGLGTMALESTASWLSKAGDLSGLVDLVASRANLGLGDASDHIPTARLGTGTANASSLLRGDNTWVALSAFGVSTFNTRAGAVSLTSADVTGALGFTPASTVNPTITGGFHVTGGRSFFVAASESFAIGAQFVSTGGAVYFGASDGTATPNAVISNSGGSALATFGNAGGMTLASGNFGIGSAAATNMKVDIHGSAWDTVRLAQRGDNASISVGLNFDSSTANGSWYVQNVAGSLRFYNGTVVGTSTGTERARFSLAGEWIANPSYANVKQYGAVGDGTTDDTAAVQAAISDTNYAAVYFPKGTYRITTALSCARNIRLFGDGPSASKIKVDAAINGLNFTGVRSSFAVDQLSVHDLCFMANNVATGIAINATWTNSGTISVQPRTCHIRNVSITPSAGGASWLGGIQLTGGDNASIRHSYITTYDFTNGFRASSFGINLLSTATMGAFETDITDVTILQCAVGIKYNADATAANNNCQGLFVNHAHIINCQTCVLAGNAAAVPSGTVIEPEVKITGSFLQGQNVGVQIEAQCQWSVSDCLIYSTPTVAGFKGIVAKSASGAGAYQVDGKILGNTFVQTGGGGTTIGISVVGDTSAHESIFINSNSFEAFTNSCVFDANTDSARYTSMNFLISGGSVSNLGTGNLTT